MNINKCTGLVLAASSLLICCRLRAQSVFDETGQKTLEKSVVMIRCVQQEFDSVTPWKQTAMVQGTGSGFVIEGKRILTNAHNVSNYKYVEVKKQNLPKRYPASVTYVGHDCDRRHPEGQYHRSDLRFPDQRKTRLGYRRSHKPHTDGHLQSYPCRFPSRDPDRRRH